MISNYFDKNKIILDGKLTFKEAIGIYIHLDNI